MSLHKFKVGDRVWVPDGTDDMSPEKATIRELSSRSYVVMRPGDPQFGQTITYPTYGIQLDHGSGKVFEVTEDDMRPQRGHARAKTALRRQQARDSFVPHKPLTSGNWASPRTDDRRGTGHKHPPGPRRCPKCGV
jgi:hypothetical protein